MTGIMENNRRMKGHKRYQDKEKDHKPTKKQYIKI